MLRAKVGHSINTDDFVAGMESIKESAKDFLNVKCNFVFTSEKNNIHKVVKGIRSTSSAPIIGCTSSGGLMIPEGYITSENGFVGIMSLNDPEMIVGVGCHEAGKDPRAIGRKVAMEAVENAETLRSPAYFYMVASPKDEEEYLMGIQDVIGRVPMFGGSAADDNIKGNWKIICNDKEITDGVAVAFFYTDNEMENIFTGNYKETKNIGLITEVKNDRELVSIDGISSLKKYSHWINENPANLKGINLLKRSVLQPLGVKDSLGNLTVIRHPMIGNDFGTKTINDDTITLGNKVVEGTAIIQCEADEKTLIESSTSTIKELRRYAFNPPAAYLLFHDAARKIQIEDKLDQIHKELLKETRGVPFIMPFTFGEYGFCEHSSNICGGLMLSYVVLCRK